MSIPTFERLSLGEVQEDPAVVLRVGSGVIPEIAEQFMPEDFRLEVTPESMGEVIRKTGPKSTMRDYEAVVEATLADAIPTAYEWVKRSGIMVPINRGLWDPDEMAPEDAVLVIMAGVPNWVRRSVERAIIAPQEEVIIAAGGRVMNSETDLKNPDVQAYIQEKGTPPTEAEHIENLHRQALEEAGKRVRVLNTDKISSWDILPETFKHFPDLVDRNVAAVRVNNAALAMALQIRLAGRAITRLFDAQDNPQLSAVSDDIALARTKEETTRPKDFQSPVTAVRQIPVLGKEFLSQTF